MPLQIIATEGVLTPDTEKQAFKELTQLLLELHGLSGNAFMTPNVVGEVSILPRGRTFSGGEPAEIVVFELKVPSAVLTEQKLRDDWISRGTDIIEKAAKGNVPRERIFGNVVYALEGAWGLGGIAYDNPALGAAIAGQAA